jgi:hypothetical protein
MEESPDSTGQSDDAQPDQNSSPPAVKTPEQLLQELQRQQLLQQQGQPQGAPSQPGIAPPNLQ